jgi:hypothetical protein
MLRFSNTVSVADIFATLAVCGSTKIRRQENYRKETIDEVAMAQSQIARTAVPLA